MEAMVEPIQEATAPRCSQLAARLVRPHRALGYPCLTVSLLDAILYAPGS